jgi:hypothetical protein
MKTIESIRDLSEEKLLGLVKSTTTKATSANVELGKILFALDSVREGKGTLKKFVRLNTGIDVPDHAFCCQVVFRGLVADADDKVRLPENVYDDSRLKWLLQSSAILNLLEKSSTADKAAVLAEVVEILVKKPEGGEAMLKKIKDSLKPASDKEPEVGGNDPEKVVEIPQDILSKAHLSAIGQAVGEVTDADKLRFIAAAFDCILEIAKGQLEAVATPAAVAA